MTNKEMSKHIKKVAKFIRKDFKEIMPADSKIVDVNWSLPSLYINLPNGCEFFFQESEASELLEAATETANKFNTPLEDVLIWQANSW